MDKRDDSGLISGFNERKQLELAVQAAEKMVGSATMSMDPEAIQTAERSISDARKMFQQCNNEYDQSFLSEQNEKLKHCEHQLQKAKEPDTIV
ncbi:DUF2564 family protein [Bacillus sp. FJAT-47783]|uniref:DUF2564 family protein n=1 Tax=Bacillus sp. FJAT-47783 TaxID=2922712 RepID=UPI001FAE2F66|nr:DUF2564 family protein [Bacillus sp. FJAT-47783]